MSSVLTFSVNFDLSIDIVNILTFSVNCDPSIDIVNILTFSVNCDPSVEAVKAQREMYTALKARKEALEEAVSKKLEELKQLCLQEGVS
jgi:hypothetical protein